MKILTTISALSNALESIRSDGKTLGFVPTMGALHAGHISLIQAAKQSSDVVICSIFVNPTQFNNKEDFNLYPITIENDIDALEQAHCDFLFLPSVEEMYPKDYQAPHYPLGHLEDILEGKYRPGHFQGVCQVVDRFLQLVQPNTLYLGKKDFQQVKVIEKMIQWRNYPIKTKTVPTRREDDGLAMSSRNMRLNEEERSLSVALHQSLLSIKDKLDVNNFKDLISNEIAYLESLGFKVDYLEMATKDNLEIIDTKGDEVVVLLIAAYIGNIRLIDNITF